MAEEDQPKPEGGAFRSVGERLGGWARRVGELVADARGRPTLPEPVRLLVIDAQALRSAGRPQEALDRLRAGAVEHPKEPFIGLSIGLCLLHELIGGGRPFKAMTDVVETLGQQLGSGPLRLFQGALALFEHDPESALDDLRRAGSGLDLLPADLRGEAQLWVHMLTGLAYAERGNDERALRELQKARTRVPPVESTLRSVLLQRGVDLGLAIGNTSEAEVWVRDVLAHHPDHPQALELYCRVAAAKGDRVAAHALLERLEDGPELLPTRIWVGLTVGLPVESELSVRDLSLRALQASPDDPHARRRWALAELQRHRDDPEALGGDLPQQVLRALADAAEAAPPSARDRYLQELAHAALRLEVLDGVALQPIEQRLRRDEATVPEELRLLRARSRLSKGERASEDFVGDDLPQFRAEADVGGPPGPDPQSPVRDAGLRLAVLQSQRALAAAERCIADGKRELAQDLLVEALTHAPLLGSAREKLSGLALPRPGERLEDLLGSATTVLAAVPNRVLGVSLEGVQAAMRQVIAARERLARPLTIAIMGEFSAGKSTFVNALLGEPVAPMGVLPTTTTINVFRRGTGGGARVHYRDGRIGVIKAEDVQSYLHGLDDTEAQRIRHVEIERTGSRMGDAAVVDTPGLNALDDFHERVAREFLDDADAVVWVFSATRGGAATEASMLRELRESGRQVLGVLNKADTLEGNEQAELAEYLRKQLGEVLVDVVPVRAHEALEWRTQPQPGGEDPFLAVEQMLDRHFLQRARELKRGLTARRLAEALDAAGHAVLAAADALEARAQASSVGGDLSSTASILQRFADRLHTELLQTDDVLVRESLGLGVLRTKKGLAKGPMDPLDVEYLEGILREAALAGLRRALLEVGRADTVTSTVLERQFVPWARGYLEGTFAAGFVSRTFVERGAAITEGEGPAKEAFREALRPLADIWARTARGLVLGVEQARQRAQRESTSTPRAEAMRLRSAVASSIETLRRAAVARQG